MIYQLVIQYWLIAGLLCCALESFTLHGQAYFRGRTISRTRLSMLMAFVLVLWPLTLIFKKRFVNIRDSL